MPGYHDLARRVEIRGHCDLAALRDLLADLAHSRKVEPDKRRHRALARRASLLHLAAALADRTERRRKLERTSRDQRRIFAEAVARGNLGLDAILGRKCTQRGDRRRQRRWLRIRGEAQILLRPLEAELRQLEPQRLVGLVESL